MRRAGRRQEVGDEAVGGTVAVVTGAEALKASGHVSVVHPAGDDASFCSGSELQVDGGYTAR